VKTLLERSEEAINDILDKWSTFSTEKKEALKPRMTSILQKMDRYRKIDREQRT